MFHSAVGSCCFSVSGRKQAHLGWFDVRANTKARQRLTASTSTSTSCVCEPMRCVAILLDLSLLQPWFGDHLPSLERRALGLTFPVT